MTSGIRATRIHESGHACSAASFDLRVDEIWANPNRSGGTHIGLPIDWSALVTTLAGAAAVRALVLGGDPGDGAGMDLRHGRMTDRQRAIELAERLAGPDRSVDELLQEAWAEARELVARLRTPILTLAGSLEVNGDRLDGADAAAAIADALAERIWYRGGLETYRKSLHYRQSLLRMPPRAIPPFLAGREWSVTETPTGFRRTRVAAAERRG